MTNPVELTITQPDDWHLHLRDGPPLASVVAHTAERFARAIVMPNLSPPLTTTAAALAYRERILEALGPGTAFEPLMTLSSPTGWPRRRSTAPATAARSTRSSFTPQEQPPTPKAASPT